MRILTFFVLAACFAAIVAGCASSATPEPATVAAPSPTPLAASGSGNNAASGQKQAPAAKATDAPTDVPAANAGTTANSQPSGPGLSGADAAKLINDKLNTVNTNLALWNIQPGLGTVMMEYSDRLARMWYAANAGNWDMAKYQHDEMLEIQEVGETTRPKRASNLKDFEDNYLQPLDDAIQSKDKGQFTDAFKKTIDGCNACHKQSNAADWKSYQYVHIQMPKVDPAPYVDWKGAGQDNFIANAPAPAPAAAAAAPTGTLDATGFFKLLFGKLNTVDTSQALWNIQPGLGTVMLEYSNRFSRMWYAAHSGNWDMAKYQHDEMLEIQEVGETTRPKRASSLKDFEDNYLAGVDQAIAAKDVGGFETAFKNAATGCNACHAEASSPDWKSYMFVKVKPPTSDNSDWVVWKAAKTTGNHIDNAPAAASPTLPTAPDGAIDAAGATKAISDTFNTPNTALALWNIQPGLGTVMMEYSNRSARLWYAIEAGNWDMAKYQHDEMLEAQEVGETTRPKRAPALKEFEDNYLQPLDDAILAQDKSKAEDAFKSAIKGCNACHSQATGSEWSSYGFIQVQAPPTDPASFIQWNAPNDTGNYVATP